MEASGQFKPKVAEVLGRALVDEDFRRKLRDDRDAAIGEFDLSDADRATLDQIPDEQLDQAGEELREGSVVGAIMAHIGGTWGVQPDKEA